MTVGQYVLTATVRDLVDDLLDLRGAKSDSACEWFAAIRLELWLREVLAP